MMPRQQGLLASLRRSRVAALVGLWLVLLQALYAVEHASARIAAFADPFGLGSGLFDICHTSDDGLPVALAADPAGRPDGTSPQPETCALCGTLAATGAGLAAESVATPGAEADLVVPALAWPVSSPPVFVPAAIHYGKTRGPPVSILS